MSGKPYILDTNAIVALLRGNLRQHYRLKLPDAVIGAMTLHHSASLITADQAFSKITDLTVVRF